MNLTGLIFGAIAAFWLIYLVPMFLHRKDNGLLDEIEPGEPFTASVTIVRRGEPLDSAENGTAVVSTPLNRAAALRELSGIDAGAARRRRVVVLFLLIVASIDGALAAFHLVPWWTLAVPGGLLVAFLVIARFSVRTLRTGLDARARVVRGGESVDEDTISLAIPEVEVDENEHSVELAGPVEMTGSLWDPIPITAPTYVSQPLAPRTVRTIDLSSPLAAPSGLPVTADLPEGAESDAAPSDRPRAVGE